MVCAFAYIFARAIDRAGLGIVCLSQMTSDMPDRVTLTPCRGIRWLDEPYINGVKAGIYCIFIERKVLRQTLVQCVQFFANR
ncbi:hypothetical protein HNR39_001966 [Glaciimonas immobilis]|uniref:Uncharacterized protein n=1 Tax=Glaciimonas immobilis TaxID=728004 RepID=A0A840RU48_9BURK|nr:hypothetical protein [Glaciimonas immobilis]